MREDTFVMNGSGDIDRFRQEAVIGNTAEGCEADAANAPLTEWQYRFNPLSGREQKRQYRTSNSKEYNGLA